MINFQPKKYSKYKKISDTRSLPNQSLDKNYCKPIKTINNFNIKQNYSEYKRKGDRDKK